MFLHLCLPAHFSLVVNIKTVHSSSLDTSLGVLKGFNCGQCSLASDPTATLSCPAHCLRSENQHFSYVFWF